MKIKFMVAATLMAALVTTTSCGNSNKQSQSEKTEQAAPAALSIDNLLVHADSLANKDCLLYTSPSPRDISGSRMPSSA